MEFVQFNINYTDEKRQNESYVRRSVDFMEESMLARLNLPRDGFSWTKLFHPYQIDIICQYLKDSGLFYPKCRMDHGTPDSLCCRHKEITSIELITSEHYNISPQKKDISHLNKAFSQKINALENKVEVLEEKVERLEVRVDFLETRLNNLELQKNV